MACYSPMKAWRDRVNPGRITFNKSRGYADRELTIPCGQCVGCRLERSRQWAVRLMHEAQMHECSCFLTLTYDEEHLPADQSLNVKHFQDFMKRYRERVRPLKLKFYHCGEYGSDLLRPHYHACIFGHDFPDRELFNVRKGNRYYISALLADLWRFGHHIIGDVTFESAAYVARYCTKKVNGDEAERHYEKIDPESGEVFKLFPEYSTQSNGLGASWCDKYLSDIWNSSTLDDFIVDSNGVPARPPRYYFLRLKEAEERKAASVKAKRLTGARKAAADNTPSRLKAREKVVKARQSLYAKREFEE